MKKRYLRKNVQAVLTSIAVVLGLFLVMLNDFEIQQLPIIIGIIITEIFILYILDEYGR